MKSERYPRGSLAHDILGVLGGLLLMAVPVASRPASRLTGKKWWQKPGLGIMYQIEYRPGMDWERDYTEFNRSMTDDAGNLEFDGPFPKTGEWVELSRQAGVDFHIMEIKWHDGICYFNTELTEWRTQEDYAAQFAEASRAAGIPFMYYYSAVFDHNPQFDPIQPAPHTTPSIILKKPQPVYEDYLRGQYREIVEQYRPDGMWMDIYVADGSTWLTLDFFRKHYPDVVLTYNGSNLARSSINRLHYTSSEAHNLEGSYFKMMELGKRKIPFPESAWKWGNFFRRALNHPWELCGPAGRWWQDPTLRDDINDLLRIVAIVLACGGKYTIGATALMDGSIFPDQARQLKVLGDWYIPRNELFTGSAAMKYAGNRPPGVSVNRSRFNIIASKHGGGRLIHIFNMDGAEGPLELSLKGKNWRGFEQAYLEPGSRPVDIEDAGGRSKIRIAAGDVDAVDTIVRLA